MNKVVDLEGDTIKVTLYDNSHSFTATDTDYTTDNELGATGGYSTGGNTLGSKSVNEAATTSWDAADSVWTSATFEAFHAVIYDTSVTNDLIASIDFSGGQSVVAGTFTIQFDASGIITLA
ncbi:hypothetical protein LCGC14_3147930 [marine sediment metagenome]|uniref:Uncharacterized protein n=1 Tax=marine sediment metagenome TaxID=412755 RepID=A0A0F8WIV7_9ZZZZ